MTKSLLVLVLATALLAQAPVDPGALQAEVPGPTVRTRWRGLRRSHALGLIVLGGIAIGLALIGVPIVAGSSRLQTAYGGHKSIPRMRQLRGGPGQILEQAQASYRDFLDDYGPLGDPKLLEQADLTSATSGVLNKIFGRSLWAQLNTQAPTYLMLPKSQRSRTSPYGWRAKYAFANTGSGGQAEGTIPTAQVSSYLEVAPTIKEHSTQMRVSGMQQDLNDVDDAYGLLAEVQGELAVEHAKEFERALNTDVDTTSGNNMESIDRVPASSANQATIGWTAGDEDIFGIDRSTRTEFDGEQDAAATARALTEALVKTVYRKVLKNGGNPVAIQTGHDTWQAVTELFEGRARYDIKVEALQTRKVGEADAMQGFSVSPLIGAVYGLPIVASDKAVADSTELSRLNILDISNPEGLDKPRLGIDVLTPTRMFLAGEKSTGAPQSIGFAGDSVLALTRHQLGCRFFKVQGQLRDVK